MADPLRYFRIEARELIDQISAGVLDLEQRPGPDPVARLLRFAHTLKGAARVVRQREIADRAHAFEEVLVPHRTDTAPLPADDMRELLRLNDEIESRVAALEPSATPAAPGTPAAPAPPADPATPAGLAAPTDPATPGGPGVLPGVAENVAAPARATSADVDDLLDAIGEAHARFAPLRDGSGAYDRLHRAAEALADQLRADRPGAVGAARAAAVRLAADARQTARRLTDVAEQVDRELDEVRGRADRLRLVPASTIFTGLHRAVRDAAAARDRRVRFEAHGGDLRMDPQVLSLVSAALLHVVRNAVAHGVESAADRATAGKTGEGRVVVQVERRGRYAAFRCSDDGRGVDLAAVRRAARDRGLLPPGAAADDQALLDLVLRGGISTSATVSDVAGRGIGLDVARDAAEQLGGEVTVHTETGRGTTVELVVPLALLSLHGLVVETAGTPATLPLDTVRSCVRLTPAEAASAVAAGRLAHEGSAVPFLPLARVLHPGAAPAGPRVAVLVSAGGRLAAAGVDRLAGTTTLVLRPTPDLAPADPVIGGVSMDLDGTPRLVLDAAGVIDAAARASGGTTAAPAAAGRSLPILVVDDSLTTRMLERSILESAGYEVDVAASGEEGLAKARDRRYALFLTDIDMPGIDGFTFVAETRADPELQHVPAILVSSRADPADRRRGAEAGAAAYVVKGEFDQEQLLGHIRRLVTS